MQPIYQFSKLDVEALEHSLNKVVNRYDVFKASFHFDGVEAFAQFQDHVTIQFQSHDWTTIRSAFERQKLLRKFLISDKQIDFDFLSPPLIRPSIVNLPDDKSLLILTHHHLLLDGFSSPIFSRELMQLYQARKASAIEPELQARPPFAEFLAWLSQRDQTTDLVFWKGYMEGYNHSNYLPCVYPRRQNQVTSSRSAKWSVSISTELLKDIEQLSVHLGVMQSAVFLAALGFLCSKYSGSSDLLIGLLLNGRPPEILGSDLMVGMFMNTLPFRSNMCSESTVEELILKAHADQLRITHHQYVSAKDIARICGEPNESRLVQIILDNKIALTRDRSDDPQIRYGFATPEVQKEDATSMAEQSVPFHCNLERTSSGAAFTVTYDELRFDASAIPGFCDRYVSILKQFCSSPEKKLDSISILLQEDLLISESYQSGSDIPLETDQTVLSFFLDQCSKNPGNVAIIYEDTRLTYIDVLNQVRHLSASLSRLGITHGDVVAFQLDRSDKVPVLILAIFYLGATYVPIDISTPSKRVNQVLDEAEVALFIADSADDLPQCSRCYSLGLLYDSNQASLQYQQSPHSLSVDDTAYIIFTSGSTGRPKGIKIPHRVLSSRILADPIEYHDNEVIASKTSFAFVDFLWELFLPLSNGGACRILPTVACKDPFLLCSYLSSPTIRRIVLVPSLLNVILDLPLETLQALSHISHWIATGEPLVSDLAARFYKTFPNSHLLNLYGASEVWDISIANVPPDVHASSIIPAGKPLSNTSVYILDDNDQPLPPGFIGNIIVSGTHISSGYIADSPASGSPFCNIRISGALRHCWRSGDLGLWSKDGELIVQGRKDNQVKVRGFRIDLNDIESVVKCHPLVRDCAVCLLNSEQLGISVLIDINSSEPEDLKQYISARLPQYMVPSTYCYRDSFPLLSSGKINRTQLANDLSSLANKRNVGPNDIGLTDTERLLVETASSLFSRSTIPIDAHFFEEGGHSLMAVRLLSKVSKQLDKQIPLESIFSHPILRDLAEYIDSLSHLSAAVSAQQSYDELSPASLSQRRLWIVDALTARKDTYILSNTISLDYSVEDSILRDAISCLIKRHSILRTTFVNVDSEPYQRVHDELLPPFIRIEPTYSPHKNQSSSVQSLIDAYPLTWSLTDGPLFYVLLISDHQAASFVSLKIHHIISDGISVKIFIEEMLQIYSNILHSRPWDSGLAALTLQYRDYAIWQYDYSRSTEFTRNLHFWSSLLSHRTAPISFLRATRGSNVLPHNNGHSITLNSGPLILKRLRNIAQSGKTTIFNVLMSIFGLYISRHVDESLINVGTPVTGRTSEELQNLIGLFVNLLVYPLSIDETLTLNELVQSVSSLGVEILSHQNMQFDQLVSKLAPDRDEQSQPLFQVMLVHEVVASARSFQASAQRSNFSSEHANYDYLLLVREHADFLEITHHVRANIFTRPVLRAMALRFNCLLSRCAATPDKPLRNISMLPSAEYNKTTLKWNDTAVLNPYAELTIASMFSNLAHASPHSICVAEPVCSWTRVQILSLATYYQSVIRSLSPEKGQRICLMLQKSAHQVALVIAINGLGHAFVPLDPNAPAERTKLIVQRCKPSILFHDGEPGAAISEAIVRLYRIDPYLLPDNLLPCDSENFSSAGTPSEHAYICFTSGSTGTPKGVVVSNLNIISLFHAHSKYFMLSSESRVLSTLGFYFDAGIGEQIRSLLSGAQIFFTGVDLLRSPSELIDAIERFSITHVGIPPSVLQALCTYSRKRAESLKVLVTAGEALSIPTAKYWGVNRTIITGHGATETTVGDTISVNWNLEKPPSLGRPLPNMRAYVVNKYLQPNPAYVIGQLVITGPQVSCGYLDDPDKTSSSFLYQLPSIRSPYRFYLTGDLVYFDSKGVLHFSGRADSQVKIRGHRVELSDIESTALSCPGVSQAVCMCYAKGAAKSLILYYSGPEVEMLRLDDWLKARLPHYMVPSEIIETLRIPLTRNGKIDYSALPAPCVGRQDADFARPTTDTERLLSDVWIEVLSLKSISISSSFFSVGGDSIQAVRMLAKCSQLGLRITPLDLYQHQTIQALASYIDSLGHA